MDLRLHEAGRHGVHTDALAGVLLGEADGEAVDGALGGRIPDVLARAADGGGAGGEVHDGTAAAAAVPRHPPDRGAGAPDAAEQVEVDGGPDRSDEHTSELQ